uniref:Uncharacterized protein n=1 Tax=Brassica oleracea var. oleracea TaxID=109376 RepID=A0A0D3DD54_BRAOL
MVSLWPPELSSSVPVGRGGFCFLCFYWVSRRVPIRYCSHLLSFPFSLSELAVFI